jgi:hypothetical protein
LCAVTVSPGSAWVGKTHRKNKEIQKITRLSPLGVLWVCARRTA